MKTFTNKNQEEYESRIDSLYDFSVVAKNQYKAIKIEMPTLTLNDALLRVRETQDNIDSSQNIKKESIELKADVTNDSTLNHSIKETLTKRIELIQTEIEAVRLRNIELNKELELLILEKEKEAELAKETKKSESLQEKVNALKDKTAYQKKEFKDTNKVSVKDDEKTSLPQNQKERER